MTTWVLVFYMSVGILSNSTGGPAVIDGFISERNCQDALAIISKRKHFDFGDCLPVVK